MNWRSSQTTTNQFQIPTGLPSRIRILGEMRHGIYLPPIGSFGDVHNLVDLAVAAEEAGWDGFFLWDHIQYEAPVRVCDAWITLSAIATSTSKIRLGPLITPLPRRRPWKVAREAVTLDHLSRGRFVLGVGLGIDFWHEFGSFSGEASDDSERAQLLDDGIEIIMRLWSGEDTTYRGKRLSVEGARVRPSTSSRATNPDLVGHAVACYEARPD